MRILQTKKVFLGNQYFCVKISSATGTRTRVFRVRAEHPNQLDYGGDAHRNRTVILRHFVHVWDKNVAKRAHPELNQGPADLQSAALTTELYTHICLARLQHPCRLVLWFYKTTRPRQDSNLRGRSPMHFECISLTTRTRCLNTHGLPSGCPHLPTPPTPLPKKGPAEI